MTSEVKAGGATPGPWRAHISEGRDHLCVVAGPDDSYTWICGEIYNDQGDMPRAEAEANAALIVQAVNSHADLVRALEKLRSYNVDIAAGRINYRPHDHIQVIDDALSSYPVAREELKVDRG